MRWLKIEQLHFVGHDPFVCLCVGIQRRIVELVFFGEFLDVARDVDGTSKLLVGPKKRQNDCADYGSDSQRGRHGCECEKVVEALYSLIVEQERTSKFCNKIRRYAVLNPNVVWGFTYGGRTFDRLEAQLNNQERASLASDFKLPS